MSNFFIEHNASTYIISLQLFTDTRLHQSWARTTDTGESIGPAGKSVPVPIGPAGQNRRTIDADRHIGLQKNRFRLGSLH
jgi:hypothetical protein